MVASLALIGMVIAAAVGVVSLLTAALVAALIMVVFKIMTIEDAFRAIRGAFVLLPCVQRKEILWHQLARNNHVGARVLCVGCVCVCVGGINDVVACLDAQLVSSSPLCVPLASDWRCKTLAWPGSWLPSLWMPP